MKPLKFTAATFALALFVTGCSGPAASSSAAGIWGTPDKAASPTLVLGPESAGSLVSGTDGCNNIMGNWSQEGDTVSLGSLAGTLMFCEGVDTWLSKAATAKLDNKTLIIFDEAGKEIGQLPRA